VSFEQIINRLSEAKESELTEALSAIGTAAAELRDAEITEETVTKMEEFATARTAIKDELGKREQLAARAAAATAAFSADEEPKPEGDGEAEGDAPAEPETPAEGEGEPEEDASAEEGGTDNQDESEGKAVVASSRRPLGGITKQNAKPAASGYAGQVAVTASLAASLPDMQHGTKLDNDNLVKAFVSQARSTANVTAGSPTKYAVAHFDFSYPEDRILREEDSAENRRKLAQANAYAAHTQALTAALCGPLEPIYDINVIGVTSRPVRDALSRFAVSRGGINYRLPFDALAGLASSGMGVWTPASDDAVNPGTPSTLKSCLQVTCPAVESASLYSTYLCLQFANFTARFDEEWATATTQAAMVAWARFAENELLKRLLAGSKLLTAPVAVSATRDILVNIDKTVAYYRNRHRMDSVVPLRLILPRWALDIMRADLARGFAGDLDALAVADAQINSFFSARNVNVTWHLDGLDDATYTIPNVTPTQTVTIATQQFYSNAAAASPIPDFPNQIEAVLFAEGDWLFLDGGTLDLGIVRDSTLNLQNRFQNFVESFEGVAFQGIESLRLQMSVEPTGAVVGTIDPPADAPLPEVTP
jgi:hypothetical protein